MKVLLVEDSWSVLSYLMEILRAEPDMEVLPPVTDGLGAVAAAEKLKPDIILMDLRLPLLDGVSAIQRIMTRTPCPIVVLSAHLQSPTGDRTFESLAAGAVDVLAKPEGTGPAEVAGFRERLLRTLRLMVGARVVRRRPGKGDEAWVPPAMEEDAATFRPSLILLGTSTGGPPLLRRILEEVPVGNTVPIAIAQHIIPGFEPGLARWLSETGHLVEVARAGDRLLEGKVYLSPADGHLVVRGGTWSVVPAEGPGVVPSVDLLFESAARTMGRHVAAFLLTGMGRDGAAGLLALRQVGAFTATQKGDTCVVNGMPEAGRALGGSMHELTPDQIAAAITAMGAPPQPVAS